MEPQDADQVGDKIAQATDRKGRTPPTVIRCIFVQGMHGKQGGRNKQRTDQKADCIGIYENEGRQIIYPGYWTSIYIGSISVNLSSTSRAGTVLYVIC